MILPKKHRRNCTAIRRRDAALIFPDIPIFINDIHRYLPYPRAAGKDDGKLVLQQRLTMHFVLYAEGLKHPMIGIQHIGKEGLSRGFPSAPLSAPAGSEAGNLSELTAPVKERNFILSSAKPESAR